MDKVKIKRVKRNKKEITAAEKIMAGVGVGSTLLSGGLGGGAKPQAQNPIVSSQGSKTSSVQKAEKAVKDFFTIPTAKADDFDSFMTDGPNGNDTQALLEQEYGSNVPAMMQAFGSYDQLQQEIQESEGQGGSVDSSAAAPAAASPAAPTDTTSSVPDATTNDEATPAPSTPLVYTAANPVTDEGSENTTSDNTTVAPSTNTPINSGQVVSPVVNTVTPAIPTVVYPTAPVAPTETPIQSQNTGFDANGVPTALSGANTATPNAIPTPQLQYTSNSQGSGQSGADLNNFLNNTVGSLNGGSAMSGIAGDTNAGYAGTPFAPAPAATSAPAQTPASSAANNPVLPPEPESDLPVITPSTQLPIVSVPSGSQDSVPEITSVTPAAQPANLPSGASISTTVDASGAQNVSDAGGNYIGYVQNGQFTSDVITPATTTVSDTFNRVSDSTTPPPTLPNGSPWSMTGAGTYVSTNNPSGQQYYVSNGQFVAAPVNATAQPQTFVAPPVVAPQAAQIVTVNNPPPVVPSNTPAPVNLNQYQNTPVAPAAKTTPNNNGSDMTPPVADESGLSANDIAQNQTPGWQPAGISSVNGQNLYYQTPASGQASTGTLVDSQGNIYVQQEQQGNDFVPSGLNINSNVSATPPSKTLPSGNEYVQNQAGIFMDPVTGQQYIVANGQFSLITTPNLYGSNGSLTANAPGNSIPATVSPSPVQTSASNSRDNINSQNSIANPPPVAQPASVAINIPAQGVFTVPADSTPLGTGGVDGAALYQTPDGQIVNDAGQVYTDSTPGVYIANGAVYTALAQGPFTIPPGSSTFGTNGVDGATLYQTPDGQIVGENGQVYSDKGTEGVYISTGINYSGPIAASQTTPAQLSLDSPTPVSPSAIKTAQTDIKSVTSTISGALNKAGAMLGLSPKSPVPASTGPISQSLTLDDDTVINSVPYSKGVYTDSDNQIWIQQNGNKFLPTGLSVNDVTGATIDTNSGDTAPGPGGRTLQQIGANGYIDPLTGNIYKYNDDGSLSATGLQIDQSGNFVATSILGNDNLDATNSLSSLGKAAAKGGLMGVTGGPMTAGIGAVFSIAKSEMQSMSSKVISLAQTNPYTPGEINIGGTDSAGNPLTLDKFSVQTALIQAGPSKAAQTTAVTNLINQAKSAH